MDIVIIEDEILAAKQLRKMLLEINPEINIVAMLEDVKSSVEWLKSNSYDLVFMDIHLSDGNSFSILEKVDINAPVIFTTAYDQYAIKAIKHNSLDYLLKPIDSDELAQSLKKFEDYNKRLSSAMALDNYVISQSEEKRYRKRYLVNAGKQFRTIDINNIAYFMADGKYLYIYTFEGKSYLADGTITKLEEELDPKDFFRINRKFCVNYKAIGEMTALSKSRLKITLNPVPENDEMVIVSTDRAAAFRKWISY